MTQSVRMERRERGHIRRGVKKGGKRKNKKKKKEKEKEKMPGGHVTKV